jgi:hypothetical protein
MKKRDRIHERENWKINTINPEFFFFFGQFVENISNYYLYIWYFNQTNFLHLIRAFIIIANKKIFRFFCINKKQNRAHILFVL